MINTGDLKRVEYKNEIDVGSWIYLRNYNEFYVAFVTHIESYSIDVFITDIIDEDGEIVVNKHNKSLRKLGWSDYCIYKDKKEFKIEDLENKKHLIDLALDLKDENWFNELIN